MTIGKEIEKRRNNTAARFDNLTIKEMEQKKKAFNSTCLIAFILQIFQRVSN